MASLIAPFRRAVALERLPAPDEVLRVVIVWGSALALIVAGPVFTL